MTAIMMTTCPQCTRELQSEDPFCPKCRLPIQPLLQRYRITKRIASGGFGIVYEAVDTHENTTCAVKVIKTDDHEDDDAFLNLLTKRFFRESKVTMVLSEASEHIIRLYDHGDDPHYGLFYVMELLEGMPLNQRLKQGALPIREALHIFHQLCVGLQVAHDRGIIHRDLKPDNIFLVQHNNDPLFVKILDFGIAKNLSGSMETKLTQGVLGTPHYLSPEQCVGQEEITKQADIYSMGVLLFELLTGKLPFKGDTALALLTAHMMHTPPLMSSLRPELNIPAALDEAVMKALSKQPEQRFATPREFWEVLQPFKASYGTTPPSHPLRKGPTSPRQTPTKGMGRPGGLATPDRPDVGGFDETFDASDFLQGRVPTDAYAPTDDELPAAGARPDAHTRMASTSPASTPMFPDAAQATALARKMRIIGASLGVLVCLLVFASWRMFFATPKVPAFEVRSTQAQAGVSPRALKPAVRLRSTPRRTPVVRPQPASTPRRAPALTPRPAPRKALVPRRSPPPLVRRRRVRRRSVRRPVIRRSARRPAVAPRPAPRKTGPCGAVPAGWRWVTGRFVKPRVRDIATGVRFLSCAGCQLIRQGERHCLKVPVKRRVFIRVKAKGFQTCRVPISPKRQTLSWRLKLTHPDEIADENYPCF